MSVPTLFIGIGGTGTRALSALQAELGDAKGRSFAYLAIDAKPEPDEPNDRIGFVPPPPAINQVDVVRDVREEIAGWWPDGLRPNANVSYRQGCGMTRAYGRFFAVYHAQHVLAALQSGIDKVIANTPRTQPVTAIDIFLIGSLTNGTGSGMFLDVAALCRVHARQAANLTHVRIVGVHVDALGIQGAEVASIADIDNRRRCANSLGALLEVDSWYRAGEDRAWRSRVRGAGTGWYDVELPPGEAPMDYTLVVQRQDRRGHSRKPAHQTIAHALALWVGGIDRTERKLDTFVATGGTSRFGSLGACVLKVPAPEIADQVEAALLLRTLDWMVRDDTPAHRAVLRDADATLATRDAGPREAALHFFREVLRVEERPGRQVNQVFDRFRPRLDALEAELDRIYEELDATEDASLVPGHLTRLEEFVSGLKKVPGEWRKESERQVADELLPAVDRMVHGLVERGAPGVARSFVRALLADVDAAWADVRATEYLEATPERRPDPSPYTSARGEVDARVAAFLSWLNVWFRRAVGGSLEVIKSFGREELEWFGWAAGVQAVDVIYAGLRRHLEGLDRALGELVDAMLRSRAIPAATEHEQRLVKALDESSKGEGVRTIGHEAGFRAWVLSDLETAGLVDHARNARLAGAALAGQFTELRGALPDPTRWADLLQPASLLLRADRVKAAVNGGVRKNVREEVVRRCVLDAALDRNARLDLDAWIAGVRAQGDERVREEARRALAERYGTGVAVRVEHLPWAADAALAYEDALLMLCTVRVQAAVDDSAAVWQIATGAQPHTMLFASYNPANTRTGSVLARMRAEHGLGHTAYVETDTSARLDRLNFFRLELGVELEEVHIPAAFDNAYRQCLGHETYHPHTDRRYGREWPVATRWDVGTERHNAALLALAVELGVVRASRTGVYSAARTLTHPGGGLGLSEGKALTARGRAAMIDFLDSRPGARTREILAFHTREALEQLRYTMRGWEGVGTKAAALAADLQALAERQRGSDEDISSACEAAVHGLHDLAAHLREADELPAWL